jgi:hypothetical protein
MPFSILFCYDILTIHFHLVFRIYANLFISIRNVIFILCLMSVQLYRTSSAGCSQCGSIIVSDKFNVFFVGIIFPLAITCLNTLCSLFLYTLSFLLTLKFTFPEDVHEVLYCLYYYCKVQIALLNICLFHYI